jgi:site-specific DNA-cytosine methylase
VEEVKPLWFIKTTRSGARDSEGNLPPEIWTKGEVHPTLNTFDNGDSRSVAIVFHPHRHDGARIQDKTSHTLTAYMGTGGNNMPMVTHPIQGNMIGRSDTAGPGGKGYGDTDEPMFSLTSTDKHAIANGMQVRRLIPVECERLQGFPDGWTEGQADTQRYKQIGNAVAVPVVEWIVKQLVDYDKQTRP